MLNHNVAPREFFSSFAQNMRCATYPPPPGSAPGYHADHHCTPRYIRKVSTGRVQIALEVQPRWKSGKKASGLEVCTPVLCTSWLTVCNCSFKADMPPIFTTATQASTTTMVIFKMN